MHHYRCRLRKKVGFQNVCMLLFIMQQLKYSSESLKYDKKFILPKLKKKRQFIQADLKDTSFLCSSSFVENVCISEHKKIGDIDPKEA